MRKSLTITAAFALAAGVATALWAYSGEQYVVCNLNPNGDNWLALKAGPNINSKRLMKLGPGTFLETWSPDPVGAWREVTVMRDINDWHGNGPHGWVHVNYICYVDWRGKSGG
ncbi:hypothetical protein C8J27_104155 [Rhodobacter aestuarii]|uniref:SH3 domain-containing protein n=1 Tax=Rhodobacter aestuarii TaxID=453582 RepID=A0A1N7KX47_9RHOB|nr:hypothetical protein [Rhodobacter aestuarii]PTV95519.1 hypothetical protein C8J27_104155 [Rhodobacter aestuarii]SIS66179.1 hypothetical protein SAMN05421580_10399 [Rhodobacter aestuarii]